MLFRRKRALGDEAADGRLTESKRRGRFAKRCLSAFGALAVTVDGNVIVTAKGTDTPPCPAVAVTGDRPVGHLPRQGMNQLDHIRFRAPSCLTGAVPLCRQTRVVAALPVDDQLQSVADSVDDDLGNDRADDLLARLRRGAGAVPGSGQILSEPEEPVAVGLAQRGRLVGIEPFDLEFEIPDRNQTLVPAPFEFARHQAVLRIGAIVLAPRPGGLVMGLPQGQLELSLLFGTLLATGLDRRHCRLHAQGLHPVQNVLGKCPVEAHPAEADAPRLGELVESAHALVTIGLAIADAKLLAAAGATQEAGQQRFAGADGASARVKS